MNGPRKDRAVWNAARIHRRAMPLPRKRRVDAPQPLAELPPEAGEHDDFARGVASAPPAHPLRKHAWLGLLCFVILAALTTLVCVHASAGRTPIPNEHVFPTP